MHDLVADGTPWWSWTMMRVLKACDHLIEMGPVAGPKAGTVIAQGTVGEVAANPSSRIAPFLSDQVVRVYVSVWPNRKCSALATSA